MNNFHFGENLRRIRTSKGYSQKMTAHSLKISQATYSRLERQKNTPDREMLDKIAHIFNIPVDELLPSSRLSHPARVLLNSPMGYLFIATMYCSLGPAAWNIADAICEEIGVSEGTTATFRRLTIPLVIFIIWYVIRITKRGT